MNSTLEDLSNTTFLIGAGLSIDAPSYIPAAAPLGDLLADWICDPAPGLQPLLDELRKPAADREPYQGVFASLRFELLLQWLEFYAPQVMDCLAVLDLLGYPNKWHYALAEAVHAGATVLTTNFDTRIEEACSDINVPLQRIVLSDRALQPEAIGEANLIKLHGSFDSTKDYTIRRRTRPVSSLNQISALGFGYERRAGVAESLRSHLDGRNLIVCGYSAWDSYDVVSLLEKAAPRKVRWHVFNERESPLVTQVKPGADWWHVSKVDTPADLVLRKLALQAGTDVLEIRSVTSSFFREVLPEKILENAAQLSELSSRRAEESSFAAERSLQEVRDLLFDEEYRLRVDESRAVVEKITTAYGSGWKAEREDRVTEELDAAVEESEGLLVAGELETRLSLKRAGEEEFEARSRELTSAGKFLELGKHFLRRIDEQHPERTPLFAEIALWAIHIAYEEARNASKFHQAWCLARLFRKTAIRRQSLWGEVYAAYLEAIAHYGWSLSKAVRAGRRKRSAAWHQNCCYELLEPVEVFAFRIPRIDLMLEAALLRMQTAPTMSARATQRGMLLFWVDAVEDADLRDRIREICENV